MLKVTPKHFILTLTITLTIAACGTRLQPAPVEETAAPMVTATTAPPAATLAPTVAAQVAAPAALADSLVASRWDEQTETSSLVALDPWTGQPLDGYEPIPLSQGFSTARSPNGAFLAVLTYGDQSCESFAGGTRCQPSDGTLHFIDLAAWRDTPTPVRVKETASLFLFSPDGRYLAIGQTVWPDNSVLLVDTASGELMAETPLDFYPGQGAFSADGARLMLYGAHYAESNGFNPQARAALLDTAGLRPLWQAALPDILDGQYVPVGAENVHDEAIWWKPAVVFAPETQRLYVVHADADVLTTVDFAAQSVAVLRVGPARSWLDRLMALTAGVAEAKMMNGSDKNAVLSADGRRLYVVGAHVDTRGQQYTRTPFDLQVIEAATGVVLQTTATEASVINLAPDGRHLLLVHWESRVQTDLLSAADLSMVQHVPGTDVQRGAYINGDPVLFALRYAETTTRVGVLDPLTFEELAQWEAPAGVWLVP